MSSCLIDERPIALQPTLIRIFGFERATVLQQLHFHLQNQKSGKIIDGHKWVWNTYEEWSKNDFLFWEPRTVRKWFSKLEEEGLLISAQFDKSDWDRRKYYRINYDAFNAKTSASKRHDDDTSESHDDDTSESHDDDTSRRPERDTSCIGTETSTEITTEREPLSLAEDPADTDNLFDTIKQVTGFQPVDLDGERKLWTVAEKLRGGNITSADLIAYASTRTKSAPKLQYLYDDICQWKNTNKFVSANFPSIAPLQIPPGLSPGETKRLIEAHVAQQRAA